MSSVTAVQMLAAALMMSSAQTTPACKQGMLMTSQVLEHLWPPDTDPACRAAEDRLLQRGWLPAFADAPAAAAAAPEAPPSAAARALDADLRRHCPDVSLDALRITALLQRRMLLHRLEEPRDAPRPAPADLLSMQQQILIDCQVVMSLAAGSEPAAALNAAADAASCLLGARSPQLQAGGAGGEALAAQAMERMVAEKSECLHPCLAPGQWHHADSGQ